MKTPHVHTAYPESLQKVLPHPQSAPQGSLWPVLISWREAQASGLSTTSQPFLPPGPACPRGGGGCLRAELRGVMWATVGGVQEAESSSWGQESPLPPGVPIPPPRILTPPQESPLPLPQESPLSSLGVPTPPGVPTPSPDVSTPPLQEPPLPPRILLSPRSPHSSPRSPHFPLGVPIPPTHQVCPLPWPICSVPCLCYGRENGNPL